MFKINNLGILYKILSCFVLFGVVVCGAVWFATSKMKTIDAQYSSILDHEVKALTASLRVNQRAFNFAQLFWREIAETDVVEIKKIADEIVANQKDMDGNFEVAKKQAPMFTDRFEQAQSGAKQLFADYKPLEAAALINDNDEALRIAKTLLPKFAAFRNKILEITNDLNKDMETRSNEQSAEVSSAITLTISSIGIALVVVLGLAFVIVQFGISRPIGLLIPQLKKLAAGDFNLHLVGLDRKDEIGQIANAVGEMAEKVSATIGEIKASGREVTNASAEISTSTSDLSQRTEEQAASLEETSAAMEELASTVRKNAESAQMANADANNTRDVADRGGKVVAKAVEAMAKIEDSSRKISDIIGVIDEIARQTNLLALNAAVEAARAGEAGRGFAVVASEVRSLAQRSSQAAKDIKDLITNSNGQVKDGVELVNKAGESLTEIVESIKKVAIVVSDIANASIEQATGIDQINRALTQMDEVTQQNSALVEENAATAKTLEHQAKAMDDQVAFFQIAAGGDIHHASQASLAVRTAAPMQRPAVARKPAVKAAAVKNRPAKPPVPPASAQEPAQRPAAIAPSGPARRMQTALATAVNGETDWKEF